jgi:hypothetical protein
VKLTASIIIWMIAAFYLYGAAVHLFNILRLSGFDWRAAPMKWQVLDVAYLALDIVVVADLILSWRAGFVAFYAAATSQIVLYTLFRDWIMDVPVEFAVSEEQQSPLSGLVIFHCVTVILLSVALWSRARAG